MYNIFNSVTMYKAILDFTRIILPFYNIDNTTNSYTVNKSSEAEIQRSTITKASTQNLLNMRAESFAKLSLT